MERVLAALTRLETRIDTIERASVSVSNASPVSPRMQHAQPGRQTDGRNVVQVAFAGSYFRRAIDGGSALGRTPMQIDELSGMGPFGLGAFTGAPKYRRGLIKVRRRHKPRWKHKRQPKRKQSIKLRRIINKHRPQRRTQTLAACRVLVDIACPTLEAQS
ncbi:unnamed protein product [Peronospora farinosa]|uniref:Uncharacterized protein n=1 Tax=Peronospora farinosa TaxID=134698 RepID=A0AAV0SUH6_9STRA|nr:unnamed protein product [Peronospora farinosa]